MGPVDPLYRAGDRGDAGARVGLCALGDVFETRGLSGLQDLCCLGHVVGPLADRSALRGAWHGAGG